MSEVKARISLDASGFHRSLSGAVSAVGRLGRAMGSLAAKLSAIGAPLSAGALAAGLKDALELGGQLSDLSARVGAPVKDLVILRQAFEDNGLAADQVGPAINRMQKALSGVNEDGQPTNKMFERLGLNMEELAAMSPVGQFRAVGEAIARLASPSERAAAAMAIFGKSGGELLTLFRDPRAFELAATAVGNQADILARDAEAFDRVSDVISQWKTKLEGFFVGVADSLLPLLSQIAEIFSRLDLAGMGQRFGQGLKEGIQVLVNAFKEGRLGDLLGLALRTGIAEGANYLMAAFKTAVMVLSRLLKAAFSDENFIFGILNTLSGIGYKLRAILLDAFKEPLDRLEEAMALRMARKQNPEWQQISDYAASYNHPDAPYPFLPKGVGDLMEKYGIKDPAMLLDRKGSMNAALDTVKKAIEAKLLEDIRRTQSASDTALPELNKTAQEYFDKARDDFARAAPGLEQVILSIPEEFRKRLLDTFGSGPLRDKFLELWDTLNKELNLGPVPSGGKVEMGTGLGAPDKTGPLPKIEGDRLAKIGLYVGNVGAALNFARVTADNTRRTATAVETLNQWMQRSPYGEVFAQVA